MSWLWVMLNANEATFQTKLFLESELSSSLHYLASHNPVINNVIDLSVVPNAWCISCCLQFNPVSSSMSNSTCCKLVITYQPRPLNKFVNSNIITKGNQPSSSTIKLPVCKFNYLPWVISHRDYSPSCTSSGLYNYYNCVKFYQYWIIC